MLKKKNKVNSLVLFDFDGTITNKDSFLDFIFFSTPKIKVIIGLLYTALLVAAYKLKLMARDRAKENVFSFFFKNMAEKKILDLGEAYCNSRINKILRKDALEALAVQQQLDREICIVTASASYWIKPWCDKNNYQLLCTGYETKAGKLT